MLSLLVEYKKIINVIAR